MSGITGHKRFKVWNEIWREVILVTEMENTGIELDFLRKEVILVTEMENTGIELDFLKKGVISVLDMLILKCLYIIQVKAPLTHLGL